jgi:dihydropteroate synthase
MKFTCCSNSFDLDRRVLIMGVLNVTPDSFSDGGDNVVPDLAIANALAMIDAGADIIDIGGESTRPGAEPVNAADELARVHPVISGLRKETDVPVSIDTWKSPVARDSIAAGAVIINDISGFNRDPEMKRVAADTGAGCVVMHMRGTPQTMQSQTDYDDLIGEIKAYFVRALEDLKAAGVAPDNICLDPGIGFSKTAEQNLMLLRRLAEFGGCGCPILLGPSRKSFIGKTLGIDDPGARIWGTAAAVALGVGAGARIIRVHDVAAMRQVADMALALSSA